MPTALPPSPPTTPQGNGIQARAVRDETGIPMPSRCAVFSQPALPFK